MFFGVPRVPQTVGVDGPVVALELVVERVARWDGTIGVQAQHRALDVRVVLCVRANEVVAHRHVQTSVVSVLHGAAVVQVHIGGRELVEQHDLGVLVGAVARDREPRKARVARVVVVLVVVVDVHHVDVAIGRKVVVERHGEHATVAVGVHPVRDVEERRIQRLIIDNDHGRALVLDHNEPPIGGHCQLHRSEDVGLDGEVDEPGRWSGQRGTQRDEGRKGQQRHTHGHEEPSGHHCAQNRPFSDFHSDP